MAAGTKADLAVLGLGVMGRALAKNFASRGLRTAVWNRRAGVVEALVAEDDGAKLIPLADLYALQHQLVSPRVVVLMVTAGAAVDGLLDELAGILAPGDIVVDAGNTWYADTERREQRMAEAGIDFVGMGVSGGEAGALRGPSLMPGGSAAAYARLSPMLEAIAARTDSGPCVTHVGPGGAGHFVKMVHNGIEYADMQLIAEVYHLLRDGLGYDAPRLAALFERWSRGPLASYLIDISAEIFTVRDPRGSGWLVDAVLDAAAQKGTGRWTVQAALDLGVAVPAISAAVEARMLSAAVDARARAAVRLRGPRAVEGAMATSVAIEEALHDALLAAKIVAYAQGLALISAASQRYQWSISLAEVARVWKGGCIIRARLLDTLMRLYQETPALENLLLADEMVDKVDKLQGAWRMVLGAAAASGVPAPAMSAALAYYDGYRCARLPHNLLQAQRDAFGAHTYIRLDAREEGAVHSHWLAE